MEGQMEGQATMLATIANKLNLNISQFIYFFSQIDFIPVRSGILKNN